MLIFIILLNNIKRKAIHVGVMRLHNYNFSFTTVAAPNVLCLYFHATIITEPQVSGMLSTYVKRGYRGVAHAESIP